MTFWKGMDKLYNLQKISNPFELNIVNQSLTKTKTDRMCPPSTLRVNHYRIVCDLSSARQRHPKII